MKHSPRLLLVSALLAATAGFLWTRRPRLPVAPGLELKGGWHIVMEWDSAPPGYDAALEGLRSHDWKKAERMARRAVAQNPASADAHYFLGSILRMRGRRAEARAEFRRALRLDPRHEGARFALEEPHPAL